jgi:ankyrin repeat protein
MSRDPKVISAGTEAVKTLIGAGAKLQPVDAAILFWPIAQGHISLVRILLELGVSASAWPNDEIGTALTPVEKAAAGGHDLIVELLVKHGAARPSSKSALQERFVRSAKFGSIEEFAALVTQGATIDGKSRDNEVALTNALWSIGKSDCEAFTKIQWLLGKGADANLAAKGISGTAPPLHQAVSVTGMLDKAKREALCADQILRELIKRGARVSARDSTGRTPLHIAAARNHVAAARLLLDSGSTVMPRDEKGRTPLDMAESGEMIKLLKQHGATER